MKFPRARIGLVTPALADANNGNWQTASRWARMLSGHYEVQLLDRWRGEDFKALIALHARRSADSIADWAARHPGRPLVVALTGTDLYRDIGHDAAAQRSLALAQRLIVLQERAPDDVPPAYRDKCVLCWPSIEPAPLRPRAPGPLRLVMVGHLRSEKDPRTAFAALRLLADRAGWIFDHYGAALDVALGAEARALQIEIPAYRWHGGVPHDAARQAIAGAHALVHPSVMEGGAHVVMEAICAGTPVLASRIPGNLGLLGGDWPAVFEPGDAAGLAALIARCLDEPAMLPALARAGAARAPLFEPAREQGTLLTLMASLLEKTE